YFFKTPRMIYLFWAYSHGLTEDRLRLYFDDFSLIPVTVPNPTEQKQIAKILATWDGAIDIVEKLIANSRQEGQALMQQLLTGQIRLARFQKQAWTNPKIGKIGEVYGGLSGKSKADFGTGTPYIPYKNVFQ